jgi:hypothetical protein
MLSGKDITIDKDGSIILNGDKYPLASQAEIDAVKGDIDYLGDTIGDITQTGVTGADVAAQIATLKGSIKGVIVDTVNLSDNIPSITANSYQQYTIPAIKAGYIPIAVVGVSYTGGVGVDVARFYVSGTDAVFLLHNVTSSIYTPDTLTAYVLYVEA